MANEFKPFISKTANIPEFIKKVSKKFQIPPSKVDFDLLNVSTGVKIPSGDKYYPAKGKIAEKLKEDAFLKSSKVDIKQSYEINVRPKLAKEPIRLVLEIAIDKFHTKATGILKKQSVFETTSGLEEILKEEINKKKVKLGMIINVRDEGLDEAIRKVVKLIRERGKLLDDEKIPIANWVAPVPTLHDKLIFHYNKEMSQDTKNEKIDYADRGFVKEVSDGDLIIEYNKPRVGSPGRAFTGRFIPVKKPLAIYRSAFKVDGESVRTETEGGNVFYYAKKDGFVSLKGKVLRIGEDMALSSINFKETGNIVTDLDKNITITTNGGEGEDDIGTNMKVETTNINIGGNIGSGAEVKAVNVVVHGITHNTSKIICTDAKIHNLRGQLSSKTAEIEMLEGGVVSCETAKIKRAKGGKIYCHSVEIDELDSNVTIFAKSTVKIRNMDVGGENRIIMDAGATKHDRIKIRLAINELTELRAKRKMLFSKYQGLNSVLKRNKPGIDEIKARLDRDKEKGVSSEKIFIDKYRAYQEDLKKAKKQREEIVGVDFKIEQKNKQVEEVQDVILNASVINEDTWKGFNKITFKTMMPPQEYSFAPEENEYAKEIRIKQKNPDDIEDGFEVYVVGKEKEKHKSKEGKENLTGKEFQK